MIMTEAGKDAPTATLEVETTMRARKQDDTGGS